MDKNILVEYSDMKAEIKDLKARVDKDRKELAKLNELVVTDIVTCGKKGNKPLRTVRIEGRPALYTARKQKVLERNIDRVEKLELRLLDTMHQVEEYIDTIEKSEIRIMLRLYYIDNLTWVQVAHRMNEMFPRRRIKYTEDNCRMRNARFLEKI